MEKRRASRYSFPVCVILALAPYAGPRPALADLQKWLIMPGPVVAGHAEIESDCSACHSPLEKRPQSELCMTCHTGVRDDVAAGSGLHGRLPEAQRTACAGCHTEHEGRDMDIVGFDAAAFDHARADFPLDGAHRTLACGDCHAPDAPHRDAPDDCLGCHRADDVHEGGLGGQCASCHTPQRWSATTFDHAATAFPLAGAHGTLACSACHAGGQLAVAAGTACIDCHRSDDVHRGQNGPQCADCHGVSAWTEVSFDHDAVSGFALTGGHQRLGCGACHRGGAHGPTAGRSCVACHEDDDPHAGRFGTACEGCHATAGWTATRFDHAARTGFALPPGHENLACVACHAGRLGDALSRDCGTCHAGDDPHEGQLGPACENCHAPASWTSGLWFDHDITAFPLLGAHAALGCDRCHATAAFHDAGRDCIACHRDDDAHGGGLGVECESCHDPSSWGAWRFDHDAQTEFPLTGAHGGLACNACHRGGAMAMPSAAGECVSCHRRDDPHLGRFGDDCANCHTTASFSRIEGM